MAICIANGVTILSALDRGKVVSKAINDNARILKNSIIPEKLEPGVFYGTNYNLIIDADDWSETPVNGLYQVTIENPQNDIYKQPNQVERTAIYFFNEAGEPVHLTCEIDRIVGRDRERYIVYSNKKAVYQVYLTQGF